MKQIPKERLILLGDLKSKLDDCEHQYDKASKEFHQLLGQTSKNYEMEHKQLEGIISALVHGGLCL